MTDGRRAGGDEGVGDNPWAPPESRPSLEKNAPAPEQQPPVQDRPPAPAQPPFPPSSVHDQATMASMPGDDFPPPAFGAPAGVRPVTPAVPSAVPPPPVAPTGPAAPGGYGYPGHPGYPGRPGYPAYGWPGMAATPQNGLGIAAMVLGILACCLFCLYGVVSVVLGILAVVFGVKGRRKAERGEADNHGQAQAGFVMGIIGIILGVVVIVLVVIGITAALHDDDVTDPYYYDGAGALRPSATAPVLADG